MLLKSGGLSEDELFATRAQDNDGYSCCEMQKARMDGERRSFQFPCAFYASIIKTATDLAVRWKDDRIAQKANLFNLFISCFYFLLTLELPGLFSRNFTVVAYQKSTFPPS